MRLTARKKILVSEAATVERAQKGKTYPAGTYIIPLSGVNRAVCVVLMAPREVDRRFVCIVFKDDMNPYYLAGIMDREIDKFLHRYSTGINLQFEMILKYFEIEIHTDKATRDTIGEMLRKAGVLIEQEAQAIDKLKQRKKWHLRHMFPD